MKTRIQILLSILAILAGVPHGSAQGTAFTYQGRLNVGTSPANGNYDLTFALYDTNSGGGIIAGPVTNSAIAVSNGLFTTMVDFGPGVFIGASNWLAIAVRTNGGGAFTVLSPWQQLTPTPYAINAQTAASLNDGMGNTAWTGGGSVTVGGWNNHAPPSEGGAFIGGGGNNYASGRLAVIGGGDSNTNGGFADVIGGGSQNSIFYPGGYSFIGGGILNSISASYAVIGGGSSNVTSGEFSTVPGGTNNAATGDFSFAAGNRAKANNTGSFVWADSQNSDFVSTAANQFNVRASGGVRFVTGGAGVTIDGVTVQASGGIAWQNVTGNSQQAQSNQGYLADNATQPVTITLPAMPSIGDIMRVTGAGAGGWQISQNSGQSVLTVNVGGRAGLVWNETTAPIAQYPNTVWGAVASSADGSRLVGVQHASSVPGPGGGGIWISSNFGGTWVQTSSLQSNWLAVASSANGEYVVAVIYGGGIFTSANYGTTWTQASAPSGNWFAVAASADGSKFFAVMEYAGIYSSSNFGSTWTQTTAPSAAWYDIATSSDGKRVVAIIGTAGIWSSTNSGASWGQTSAASTHPGSYWQSIASSADGSHLAAVMYYGGIYTSTDFGTTWWQMSSPATNWVSVASSSDGSKLVAASTPDGIYTSTNCGSAWTKTTAPSTTWTSVSSSSDGSRLVAADYGGGIYTSASSTSSGSVGGLSGTQGTAIELQYVGNGQFISLSHEGAIRSY